MSNTTLKPFWLSTTGHLHVMGCKVKGEKGSAVLVAAEDVHRSGSDHPVRSYTPPGCCVRKTPKARFAVVWETP